MNVLYPETTSAALTSPDVREASRVSLASRRYRIVLALLPLVALLILAAIPAMAEPEPKCPTPTVKGGPACWIEVENQPGCFVWNPHPATDETVTWSGSCSGGLPDGHGTQRWRHDDGESSNTGRYVDGKKNGVWSEKLADGTEAKGPYVDGKKNGVWSEKWADGTEAKGPYVDGKKNGVWSGKWANGREFKGPYVNGKENGVWSYKWADGTDGTEENLKATWVDGKQHGEATRYRAGKCLFRETYVYGHMTEARPC